jgi:hypothetical protein
MIKDIIKKIAITGLEISNPVVAKVSMLSKYLNNSLLSKTKTASNINTGSTIN